MGVVDDMSRAPFPDSYSLFDDGDQLKLFDAELVFAKKLPDFHHEIRHHKGGRQLIAGVDEAGRGPLAGPVVAAAVILDPDNLPKGLNDSKKLTEVKRLNLFDDIFSNAHVAWAASSSKEIDETDIRISTLNAMTRAVKALPAKPDHVMIDGRDVPFDLHTIGSSLIKGDAISISIAAASIVAKTIRDKIMKRAAVNYPHYGFENHKGYGAATHMHAISEHGPCEIHRMSFSPMREK